VAIDVGMVQSTSTQPIRVKPRLRGLSHLVAFVAAVIAGAILVAIAAEGTARLAATVYAASFAGLFGTSALYHVPFWHPRARARLRRVDHAAIFVLIAGTYTPICLLGFSGEHGQTLLVAAWIGAALGVARAVLWLRPPRWLTAGLYVALGCVAVIALPDLARGMGPWGVGLVVSGGAVYIAGAVIYALRRPDPLPAVFGYHEVFHLLVIVAGGLHFAAVTGLVT
jgi:hemolysin III